MKALQKILIANRGEIACRIMRTCRAMGIASVAVYSDADVHALHVRTADEAVYLGAAPVRDSYLNGEKIIAAAQRTGCDAVHPGYGFLAENADFAAACANAGIVFIGPAPEVIRQMGLKSPARKRVAAAGVAVVPGYDGAEQSSEQLCAEITRIGCPVLIKASAGGGGKGMRVVRSAAEAQTAIAAAQREAEKAFGDSTLLLEKYIEQARHVEVQICGDQHGNIMHLFERDCSVQRRHQKIIEESPSPAITDELRQRICAAAVTVGQTINYTNAGTVEFILAPDDEFYFIEVNTRLQVEHPVTEMITGYDLVQLQIEIAEGKPLPFTQAELKIKGHAIEARLYAEDPDKDFLPATGTLHDWQSPATHNGLRIDAGLEAGTEVGIHYDPLLAKLIAYGADRESAIRKLVYALRNLSAQGVTTNRDFLLRVLTHKAFQQGTAHTNFISEHAAELIGVKDAGTDRACAIAAALYLQHKWQQADSLLRNLPPGYRNNPYRDPALRLKIGDSEIAVAWRWLGNSQFAVTVAGETTSAEIIAYETGSLRLALDGVQRRFRVTEAGDSLCLHSPLGARTITRVPRYPAHDAVVEHGSAESPMPGQVLKMLVREGQSVSAGDGLVILEAMKMEQTIRAGADGIVTAIKVSVGQVVSPGDVLVQIGAVSPE